jgi:hypothetical protein
LEQFHGCLPIAMSKTRMPAGTFGCGNGRSAARFPAMTRMATLRARPGHPATAAQDADALRNSHDAAPYAASRHHLSALGCGVRSAAPLARRGRAAAQDHAGLFREPP